MAQAPGMRTISSDLFSGEKDDQKKNFDQLAELLNPVLSGVSIGMNKGLSLRENLNTIEKEIVITTPERVWTTPTLDNSWVNYDAGTNSQAGYRIDDQGVVRLRGLVKNGSAIPTTIFTLPVGYRPKAHLSVAVSSNNAYGQVSVLSTGEVKAIVGNTAWVSLDGITFDAKSPVGPPSFQGGGWPLLIDSGQQTPILDVKVGYIIDMAAIKENTHGGGGMDWEPGPAGKVIIRSFSGLTPERRYKIKLLLYPTY